jgi:hypothetical protein
LPRRRCCRWPAPGIVVAAPITAAHLLSTHGAQRSLDFQYAVAPVALLFVASIFAVRRLATSKRLSGLWRRARIAPSRRATALCAVLLVAEAAGFALAIPLGPPFDASLYRQTSHTHAIDRVLALVPPGASVSAQTGLLPHLSERRDIPEFPDLGDARFVVVDQRGRRSTQSVAAGYDGAMQSLPLLGYCLRASEDGVRL